MKELKHFPIYQGSHCASTSLSEIMTYYKNPMDEPTVFALSSGIDILYLYQYYDKASRLFFVRSPLLEPYFFENLDIDFKWKINTPLEMETIIESIDLGHPILVLTDPGVLDFFEVNTPSAAAHTLTIIGYDFKSSEIMISDSISNEKLITSYENLIASMNVKKPPFYQENMWSVVKNPGKINNIEKKLIRALIRNAEIMLQPKSDHNGIDGLKKLRNEIEKWHLQPNYKILCSNSYNSIENIGTGGSGFRKLFNSALFDKKELLRLSEITIQSAINSEKLMKKLGKYFYLESREGTLSYVEKIQNIIDKLIESESLFWESLLKDLSKVNIERKIV